MKKILIIFLLLVMCCSCTSKGLKGKKKEEVENTLKEYREKLVDVTWHNAMYPTNAFRFFSDGRVEEIDHSTVFSRGVSDVENGWTLKFSDEYDKYNLEETDQKRIEKYFKYYVHFTSPMRADEHKYHIPIFFDENGDLYMWDEKYVKGVDYIEGIPDDAYIDEYFTQTVWGFDDGDGTSSRYWIMWDNGWGAETVGSYMGELIYPTYFQWAFKDDMLYIDWYVTEDSNIDIDAYVIKKGDLNFQMTHYWSSKYDYHMVPSGDIDLLAGFFNGE